MAGDGEIHASWERPTYPGDPTAEFIVEIRQVGERSWFEHMLDNWQDLSTTIDYVDNGVTYEVRVVAFNIRGHAYSEVKRVTPRG